MSTHTVHHGSRIYGHYRCRSTTGGREPMPVAMSDLATRAWNLSVALMYKARVIPWRLADVMDGSCFVGISFFHPEEDNSTSRTSVAQAFAHRGEGFVLQGDKFTWKPSHDERAPHLDRDAAKAPLKRVLSVYEDEVHGVPQRLIIHKTSRYTVEEREGFAEPVFGWSP